MRLRLRRMMDPTVPSDPLPLVLFNTSFFGRTPPAASTPTPPVCRVTCDRRRLREADIVLFHLPDAWELGDAMRQPGQIWVAYMMESPAHYPLWRDPTFMNRFDLVMSHERSADIWTPYLPSADAWRQAMAKPVPAKTELAPVVLFQSANVDRNGRNDFAFDLMKAIRVDSYGRLFHNRDLAGPISAGDEARHDRALSFLLCLRECHDPGLRHREGLRRAARRHRSHLSRDP